MTMCVARSQLCSCGLVASQADSGMECFAQGSLDILVQRTGNSGAARQPVFIKNNYFHDAFFLKAQGALLAR